MLNPYHSLSQLWSHLPSDSPRKIQWVESLPSKWRILKKRERKKREKEKRKIKIKWSNDWKAKEVKRHMKSSMFQKERRKRGWNLQAVGRDFVERKQERRSHFPIVQIPICGLIHTHKSIAFAPSWIAWLFPFLPPLPHHSPSTMIIDHTSSIEFSFIL
jgi:hypothetical protein